MESGRDDFSRMLSAARLGEPGAAEQMLEAFRPYLCLLGRACIQKALQGKTDPSDLVQETLYKAYKNLPSFRGEDERELAGWLRGILAQNVVQLVRRFHTAARAVSRERSLDEILSQSSAALSCLVAASGTSPSLAAQRRDVGMVLAEALQELRPEQREVIVLRNLDQLPWAEIALRMDRSVDAVRMLWTRGLSQLRPLIEGRL